MRPADLTGGLSATLLMLAAATLAAQQIATPNTLPSNGSAPAATRAPVPATTYAPPGAATAPGGPAYTAPGAGAAPSASTFAPTTPGYVPPPGAYSPGAMTAPGALPPAGGYAPSGPAATLEGTIAPWDPYAMPGAQTPPSYPEGPAYGDFPHQGAPVQQRLLQRIKFDYLWMAGASSNELGINNLELSATFALPFFYNTQTPILVTPGFGIHYWNGPISPTDLPPRTYDAYLDLAWAPQITERFSGELDFRVGIYSDFSKVTQDSIRLQGRGMAVLTMSERFQVKFGVWYINRNSVKILPAGGVVWTPNSDVRFEILFPNPKLAQRLTTWGTTEWWWYVRGEYGGGAWTIKRDPANLVGGGSQDSVDYNDLRVALGLEFVAMSGLNGYFEIGAAFDREVYYVSRTPTSYFRPNNTVFLRAGITY